MICKNSPDVPQCQNCIHFPIDEFEAGYTLSNAHFDCQDFSSDEPQTFTIDDMQKAFEAGRESMHVNDFDNLIQDYNFSDFMKTDYKIEIKKELK